MHHATRLLTVHHIMSLPIKSRVRDLHGVMEHFDFCIQSNFISVRMHYIQNARGPTSQLLDPTRSLKILRPMTLRINPQKLWGYISVWQHHTGKTFSSTRTSNEVLVLRDALCMWLKKKWSRPQPTLKHERRSN